MKRDKPSEKKAIKHKKKTLNQTKKLEKKTNKKKQNKWHLFVN